MANYLAQRVIDEIYTYTYVVSRRPDLKNGIDSYLIKNEREDLITNSSEMGYSL
uniref:hypothetical protein n=1 Tax=Bacillus thuringiensis TaxID=1428 RepID=UPI00202AF527|nr:hypothetical protein [Bacillus thuringiensis]UQM92407.1 hypothetical protein SY563_000014 [Bacillus thuringiensis]